MKILVKLAIEKETKGAIRYAEIKENPLAENIIGTLYVRKSAFASAGKAPQHITVTIESEEIAKCSDVADYDERRSAIINDWAEKYVDQGPDILAGYQEADAVAQQMLLQLLIVDPRRAS